MIVIENETPAISAGSRRGTQVVGPGRAARNRNSIFHAILLEYAALGSVLLQPLANLRRTGGGARHVGRDVSTVDILADPDTGPADFAAIANAARSF
jgi:hypothetical protein